MITLVPIGVVRSPFTDKSEAPRQPAEARAVEGSIVLEAGRGFEHALEGITAWDHLWVIYWFHGAEGAVKNKVQPPRSAEKKGVFATRSPHRPNAIGLSAVRLLGVDGLTLRISGLDMIDGTPVLDLKPYVPYSDAIVDASSGWLDAPADPGPRYVVEWTPEAARVAAWLGERGVDVVTPAETILKAGPEPHPYRRIKQDPGGGLRLAVKAWRYRFEVVGDRIVVRTIESGYRPKELARANPDEELRLHRDMVEAFGAGR
jgi:tRNA-Thr(GGU) m(6)t(6)A37 methyltransferase TsaA